MVIGEDPQRRLLRTDDLQDRRTGRIRIAGLARRVAKPLGTAAQRFFGAVPNT
jgi:hypothetical protein